MSEDEGLRHTVHNMNPRIVTMGAPDKGKRTIHVNTSMLWQIMKCGLDRAAAFLGYGIKTTAGAPLASVALDAAVFLQILPDPLPAEQSLHYRDQFRYWVVGQGLIELDQTYHRFLSGVLDTCEDFAAFRKGKSVRDSHKARLENTAALHNTFRRLCSSQSDADRLTAEYLRSLGNARNCLVHDSGIVTRQRIREGGKMTVQWIAEEMFQEQHDGSKRPLPREIPYLVRSEDVGKKLSVEPVIRKQVYAEGDRITLSPHDLAEIMRFYLTLATSVLNSFDQHMEECKATRIHRDKNAHVQ